MYHLQRVHREAYTGCTTRVYLRVYNGVYYPGIPQGGVYTQVCTSEWCIYQVCTSGWGITGYTSGWGITGYTSGWWVSLRCTSG